MQLILYFFVLFAAVQFLVVLSNYIFREPFVEPDDINKELISVLIPARNEEENIPNILDDLLSQNYSNIEVLVCNDHSDDKTKEIVLEYSRVDSRIRMIDSKPLPKGWLGKNWACYQLSKMANGSYFLFLDSDVRIETTLLSKSIHYLNEMGLGMFSIFPVQKMKTNGEYNTVPLMHYILVTLLPLSLVKRSRFRSLSAANGQFMFYKASIYNEQQPHENVKGDKVEDIRIAQKLKAKGIKIGCLTGLDEISCRMYHGYREGIIGFSKNMAAFFGNSYLFAFLFWALTTLPLFLIPIYGDLLTIVLFFTYFIGSKILFSLLSKQNVLKNLILTIPQHITMFIILIYSIYTQITKQQQWKGRSIS
ncbi:MAG TPA: glycosyltransferase family 2 protein [Bacteroidales bacterium]|nr:glycosyltransferase family 2 protein [Bacteroidales bacterium]